MPTGYLVTLGDGKLDEGDKISSKAELFTEDHKIGAGKWSFTGTRDGKDVTDHYEEGTFVKATNGNVYFIPDNGTPDSVSSAQAVSAPHYSPNATFDGTEKSDTIELGSKDADGDSVSQNDNQIEAGGGDDFVKTGEGNDSINAGSGNDTVYSGSGDDHVEGESGDDQIDGGWGQDTISGGDGRDEIRGGEENDTLYGGAGSDGIDGGSGNDTIYGDSDPYSGEQVSITANDLEDSSLGFSVTAQNVENGKLTDPSGKYVSTVDGKIGASGASSNDKGADPAKIGYDKESGLSERVSVQFKSPTEHAEVHFSDLNSATEGELGHWAIYNDGKLIAEGDFKSTEADGSGTIDLSGFGSFDQIVMSALPTHDSNAGSDYALTGVTFVQTGGEEAKGDADKISGGSGDDVIYGEDGDDQISGDSGNDTIYGGDGHDQIKGGSGSDRIDGGSGDDHIDGGLGADRVEAGLGNNTVFTGQGDTVSGGSGDDMFILTDYAESGAETITIEGGQDREHGGDTLDFNGLLQTDSLKMSDDGTGSYSGTATLKDGSTVNFSGIEKVVCFTQGTQIETPHGPRLIENLRVGDSVLTRDHGPQPIRWVGQRTVPAKGAFAPVRFAAGTLGNAHALMVSPQHRILSKKATNALLFGEREVLVAALHLVNNTSVRRCFEGQVTYFHLLFDQHELVFAEGCETESFFPGREGLDALDGSERHELFSLFPELRSSSGRWGDMVRPCLKGHEGALLAENVLGAAQSTAPRALL